MNNLVRCAHRNGPVDMYLPPLFREDRISLLHEAISEIGFATLVTVTPEGPMASHIPMFLDPRQEPQGTLIGHIARANPQWRDSRIDIPALAMFLGPHSYVTPSWYLAKQETGEVVPTWNYVAVHATGRVRFIDDAEALRTIVTRLTSLHESSRAQPWKVTDAPPEYVNSRLEDIIGIELQIDRLEGKYKLSQNRPAEDVPGIIQGLGESDHARQNGVADAMRRIYGESEDGD